MWNWSSRMFLTETKQNMTKELEAGTPTKYTTDELDEFEKVLKDHEAWLNEWVEKQKSVKMNEDPVILSSEMRARAKVLENHLQKLYRKRPPKVPKKSSSSSSSSSTTASTATTSATATEETASASGTPGKDSRHEEL